MSSDPQNIDSPQNRVVLIVEDDAAVVDATTMLLESAGFDVIGSADATSAIALIESGLSPNLIITDYRMPGLSGVDMIQQLRSDGCSCTCILLTGATNVSEIESAHLEDCVVLSKPVHPDKLLELVGTLVT